ncbi:aconitate hydratase, cytoplasmic [Tanacetum coccineum]
MAQNGDFDWSPNIPLKIYGTNYIGFIRRLVKVLGKNSQTRFIERGVENTKYVNIMLETHDDERALEVHMRQDNLYVEAMGRRGGQYTIFKLNGVKNFGAGSKELGFGENYTSLTRHLGDSIYSLNFLEFTQAVETLIDDMSVNADDLDGLTTYKWRRRMFTVVTAVAEAARSKVVSLSYDQSRERRAPTSTSWMWIKLLFNNWEKFQGAIGLMKNRTLLI